MKILKVDKYKQGVYEVMKPIHYGEMKNNIFKAQTLYKMI